MLYIIFVILLVVNFRVLENTPLMDVDKIVGIPFIMLGSAQFTLYKIKISGLKSWLICFVILGLISSITSATFFHQKLTEGFIASLYFFNVMAVLPFSRILNRANLKIKSFQKLLLLFVWSNFFLKVFLLGSKITWTYTSYFSGLAKDYGGKEFGVEFINMGIIYYFFRFLKTKSPSYAFLALVLYLTPDAFEFQRQDFAFMGVVLSIILFKDFKKNAATIFTFVSVIVLLVLVAFSFFFQQLEPYLAFFGESLKIFGNAHQVQDKATADRVEQFQYLASRAFESPIFGLGIPRAGARTALFGTEQSFNFADMGVFGIYFTHGIIGVIVYIYQTRFVYKLYKKVKANGLFVNVLYFYLVYITVQSIGTANVFEYPYHFLTVYILILYFKKKDDLARENLLENDLVLPDAKLAVSNQLSLE